MTEPKDKNDKQEESIVLLPCPFCGSIDIGFDMVPAYSLDSSYGVFGCRDCGARFETQNNVVSRSDIETWNTRSGR
jgi:Lar family restriction alleviation protein